MEMVTVEYMNKVALTAFVAGIAFVGIVILVAFTLDHIVRKIINRNNNSTCYVYINGKRYGDRAKKDGEQDGRLN